ncbi:MAG: hypothetical protein JKY56_25640 [Kofleriaceae bacterium]|nr:hypothetical protein [Kofleriaceae bacterium]
MNKVSIGLVLGFAISFAACGKDTNSTNESSAKTDDKKPTEAKTPVDKKAPEVVAERAVAAPPEATAVRKLDVWAHQIVVPESWKGKQLSDKVYKMDIKSVRINGVLTAPTLAIMKYPTVAMPQSLDEAAKCKGGKLIEKEELEGKRYYVACSNTFGAQTMTSVEVTIPLKDGGLVCTTMGLDIAVMKAACQSLRAI